MQPLWARAVRFGRDGMEPILVLVVITVLRQFGLSGDTPLGLVALALVAGAVWQQPAVQRRMSGGDPQGRLWLRIGVHILQTTTVMYMVGWGALLAVAHLHVFTLYLRTAGSRSWQPRAASSAVTIALGELAYEAGLLHGYLPQPAAHGVSMLIALGTIVTSRVLVGMLFLDLDGFKQVNDTYGHDVGDRLLTTIAETVRRTVRDTDTVGRLGGDEFGVVLSRVGKADEAMAVARRIINGIAHSSVAGLKLDVGCSIGVALAYPGGSDATTLLRHADTAMYRSKRRARNGYQLYVEEPMTAPWLL